MITSDAPWAPLVGFALSVVMIRYGESIIPFSDEGGANLAGRLCNAGPAGWKGGQLREDQTIYGDERNDFDSDFDSDSDQDAKEPRSNVAILGRAPERRRWN